MAETVNHIAECGLPVFFDASEFPRGALPPPRNPHGQSVRVFARSLSVMQKEAIVVSALTGRAWRLASDEGPYLDGFDAAPCPLAFLSTGMVSSYMNEIVALARSRGIDVRGIELVQDNFYTMEGSALRGTMTGGALPVELEVRLGATRSADALQRLVTDAVHASPLNGLMRGVHESRFSLRLNGAPVPVDNAASMEPLAVPDPGMTLARMLANSAAGDRPLVERLTAVETKTGIAGGAHTSLADTQSRKLHLRATCRLRDDGVKEIEQQIFRPLGSTFRFASDEADGFGGRGAAPDAVSYAAAGIAFCFMTQLGRYAKIVAKNLDAYDVVQDAHFSLGGASAGTGRPGSADPIETHVYLTSSEDETFARKVVQMGEQTCFLHALCRTDLKTNVRIAPSDRA